MTSLSDLLQQNSTNLWLFIPSAIMLGALHGLEPGHSKTMMAAFIIAVRGTMAQAVLLGLSAAASHSLVVWVIALAGLSLGRNWNVEATEPYFQMGSAFFIVGMAIWMFRRTQREMAEAHDHDDGHHHGHGHTHGHDEAKMIDTGHGILRLSIFEEGVPPIFVIEGRSLPPAREVTIETIRPDGTLQIFGFKSQGKHLVSISPIPEPHEFKAVLIRTHGGHAHRYEVEFTEPSHAHHSEAGHTEVHPIAGGEYEDAHEREHALDIERRFAGKPATTWQIVLFGLTGGLMPCPASVTVLLICLQLKRFALGFTLVLGFSFGLALTMVTTGALAAWSVHHAQKHFKGFGNVMRTAPYASAALLLLVAAYMGLSGLHGYLALHGK